MSDPEPLADAIARAATTLSNQARGALVAALRAGKDHAATRSVVPDASYRASVDHIFNAWDQEPSLGADAMALAIDAAAQAAGRGECISIVWTGPTTPSSIPVRRTDQALLDLIGSVTKRVIVVSFAVYNVPAIEQALATAAARGVNVDLVFDTQTQGDGAASHATWKTLAASGAVRLLTWPVDKRPTTKSGKPASLHAKFAVVDGRRLLVSSANLTHFAHELNMELGLLVERGNVPRRVQSHVDALIASGQLAPVER